MTRTALILCLAAAACATPPRIDDRTNPEDAYRTFRGALARDEVEREYACFSDQMRKRFGIASRADYLDMRVVVRGSIEKTAIVRSKIRGSTAQPDGRVLLDIGLPLGFRAKVWMRPVAVLRIQIADEPTPIYEHLVVLELVSGPGALGVKVPDEILQYLGEEVANKRITAFEARVEWFIDDIATK